MATAARKATAILWSFILFLPAIPFLLLFFLYGAGGFDPAPIPEHHPWFSSLSVPARNDRLLRGAERLAEGLVSGPEDLIYDASSHHLYTGCQDGWIKRIGLSDDVSAISVENWTHTGGRPLGLAIDENHHLIVADALKGLLRVSKGEVKVLTEDAEGLRFGLINCVDVARDGVIYFTDTSHKYKLGEHLADFLEGRPHGRLMSFDPSINQTKVLLRDLYFVNGVALSPDQDFLVFCETTLRRCRKYHILGDRKGSVDDFIDNTPGFPDNIHWDGELGVFWIAYPSGRTFPWYMLIRYPVLRKAMAAVGRFVKLPKMNWDSGVLSVSLEGKPVAMYTDPTLVGATCGLKVGRHLYYGSLAKDYVSRLDLVKNPARQW